MGIMFNCLYTIPLCDFGLAFSHAICVFVKYFGKLLLKTIWQPKSSPILYYSGENRYLKSPIVCDITQCYWNAVSESVKMFSRV